ncbi:sigma-70 family RNA polymerase sigma factor [Dorea sp. 5-2]|nr:sigma-70 family RNA polymerase sigma factor [Dorea sp. 5-2]
MKFEDIYKQYNRDVYYFLLSMSGNPELAEELTQETFYRALTNIHRFKGECQLKSWLCQIGKNAYLSWAKKQKHLAAKELEPEKIQNAAEDFRQTEGNPETQCIRKDETLSIYRILHLLDEPYKEVFILRILGELSYKEIGEIFGRGEGWARVNYHRAKLKIQEMIKEVP